ncbi:MAG: helix-turn-helix transcriptional regulator [Verrucomicrobiota bacterium]
MKKTNFDVYLDEQLKAPSFAQRFEKAGEAWDVALQIAALREKAGFSQKDLARKLRTSQQNISRLESPSYEGHSLTMLRRVADVLGATISVTFAAKEDFKPMAFSEAKVPYKIRRKP